MRTDSAPVEPDESKETKKPKTYGEPFIRLGQAGSIFSTSLIPLLDPI
jgi:hypothetical protein